MKYIDLKCKEVVNAKSGAKLGCIVDLDFDILSGCICSLFVAESTGFCASIFSPIIIYEIPYQCIVRIGPDVIIVNVNAKDCIVK